MLALCFIVGCAVGAAGMSVLIHFDFIKPTLEKIGRLESANRMLHAANRALSASREISANSHHN